MNLSPVGATSAPVYEPPPASLNHGTTPGAVTRPATAHGSDHHHHHDGGGADSATTQSGQLPAPSDATQEPSAAQQDPEGGAAQVASQGVPPTAADVASQLQSDLTGHAAVPPAATPTSWTGPPAAASARASAAAASNLSSLATATGISPGDLLKQLNAGDDLSDLLGSAGDAGYSSTVGAAVSGGVAVDEYA